MSKMGKRTDAHEAAERDTDLGTHIFRGSGFTHHAKDDCGQLPPREPRQCSRFTIHGEHPWGANSLCKGRTTDVRKMAGVAGDEALFWSTIPSANGIPFEFKFDPALVGDPNVGPNMAILGDFYATVNDKPTTSDELTSWYIDQARSEVEQLTAKMAEYGGLGRAVDLIEIGRNLALTQGREVDDEEATELGIYFYALGKMARWTAAIAEGRRVSDDTLHDQGVYIRMAQRNRAVGGWPV